MHAYTVNLAAEFMKLVLNIKILRFIVLVYTPYWGAPMHNFYWATKTNWGNIIPGRMVALDRVTSGPIYWN